MKEKGIKFITEHGAISIVIVVAFILHMLALLELGYQYNLGSDDASYIQSGITLFQTGKITMHGVLSAQIMPGMPFLISFLCIFFGTGSTLVLALKIVWMLMGLGSIVMLYRIVRLYANQWIAAFVSLFLLAPDFIWMNQLILTETPFMFLFLFLIYHSLCFIKTHANRDYIWMIVSYILCLFVRPTIGLYPIFLAIVLLFQKYPFGKLMKQGLIAGGILLLCLAPWTYRNYRVFGKVIPLTYGMGNPLLLGTYQGYGFPLDEELDYEKNVDRFLSKEMKHYLSKDYKRDHMKVYASLEYDGLKAKYRIQEWWKKDPISMLKSYCYHKPKLMFYSSFYWKEILGIDLQFNLMLRRMDLILCGCSILILCFTRRYWKELCLLCMTYGYHIFLYSYSFTFERYAITLFFLRFIVIGMGISVLYELIIKKRGKANESINDCTSI